MNVLELFAGSRSIGKVAESYDHNVFSSDINEFIDINYVTNILDFDVLKVPFIPDFIWCSPPCTYFSVASIGTHWNKDNTPKTKEAILGVAIVQKTLDIINHFLSINPSLKYYIENPRGKLRSLPILKHLERTTIWYCQYGDHRAKPTDIWSNNIYNPMFNLKGWKPRPECSNGNKNCHHESAPRGSKTGTQGLKNNYERSKIPPQLCEDIIKTNA
tara:strand:+ start:51 stop:698 length:648 start_codon:yes stop_codon:yes gene_type:complete